MAMETLSISLPEGLKSYIEERVVEGGYGDTSDYITDLIREDRERRAQARLEKLLLEGLDSGEPISSTPEYWRGFREEARKHLAEHQQDEAAG